MFYPFVVPSKSAQPTQRKAIKGIYEVVQETNLGGGAYGVVKLVKDKRTQKQYAIKIVSKAQMHKHNAENHIKSEISIHSQMRHKHIVRFYENLEDNENIYMLLEYCNNGTIWSLVRKRGKLSEEECFPYIYQILLALQYMHDKGIVHRDLKADNVLLKGDVVKLCDFNWSVKLEKGHQASPSNCGTSEYMPPEVVKMQPHDASTDIWSLGVLILFMLNGELPYKAKGENKQKELREKICNEKYLKFSESISPPMRQLLGGLLGHKSRYTLKQIFHSNWMMFMMMNHSLPNPYDVQPFLTPVKARSSAYEYSRLSQASTCSRLSHGPAKVLMVSAPALKFQAFRAEEKQSKNQ